VIGEGKDGKLAPEKLGLAPEQGKGIEYEFDLLLEMDQKHNASITKDHTSKFQDAIIEKPGEDFGVELYEWLASGKPETQAAAGKTPAKPEKANPAREKPKPEKQGAGGNGQSFNDQGGEITKEIGAIITAAKGGRPYFTEEEKEDARQVIKSTRPDEKGIADLRDFKTYLSDVLAKREKELKKAA